MSSGQEIRYFPGLRTTFDEYIINGINSSDKPLFIHCQSRDDDLGEHYLKAGEDFHWHFWVNFFRTTLFFCHMKWEDKETRFDVFTAGKEGKKCDKTGNVYWLVQESGFYLSDDKSSWSKQYDWP
ncbi:hypothetical protein WN944_026340 [Citrus x changshan-huyou]|uniref:S-protein homolog n=2 Tax=Citrus TaxID=2706 RepID=A0A067DKL9_CITSI|nr:hypothetical protein CISIN_1g042596mg [Citrus sinensis]